MPGNAEVGIPCSIKFYAACCYECLTRPPGGIPLNCYKAHPAARASLADEEEKVDECCTVRDPRDPKKILLKLGGEMPYW